MLTELSAPLVESSLPRTSWRGCRPPPPPTPPPADLMLRLRQTLHRTLRKCCACREIGTSCESAAPAAKSGRTLRKYCTCRESVPDLAKVLRLLRNLYLTFLTPLVCRRLTVINAPFAESSLFRSSSPFVESSLLRTSWGGSGFVERLQSLAHPLLNHHFLKHHGGGCRPP